MQSTLRKKQLVKTGLTLLFLLLIACITCSQFFYSAKQWLIQKKMREHCSVYLHPKDLEKITVRTGAISQLQWKEKNEEFYLDEVLYDVVSKREYADSTVYFCIRDREEQHVIDKLNFLVKHDHHRTSQVCSQILKIFFSLYYTSFVQEYQCLNIEGYRFDFTYMDRLHFLWHCFPDAPPPRS